MSEKVKGLDAQMMNKIKSCSENELRLWHVLFSKMQTRDMLKI